jgi:predicted transcriptional regulator
VGGEHRSGAYVWVREHRSAAAHLLQPGLTCFGVGLVLGKEILTTYIHRQYLKKEAALGKEAVFTMKLEPELRDAFMAAAKAADRPASQIVREFMRDFVQQDREYVAFLQRKVEQARADIAAGRVHSHEEVMAEMDELVAELERKSRGADAA